MNMLVTTGINTPVRVNEWIPRECFCMLYAQWVNLFGMRAVSWSYLRLISRCLIFCCWTNGREKWALALFPFLIVQDWYKIFLICWIILKVLRFLTFFDLCKIEQDTIFLVFYGMQLISESFYFQFLPQNTKLKEKWYRKIKYWFKE